MLDTLDKRYSVPQGDVWQTSDFHCRRLAHDTFLLTCMLLQGRERLTRRSTVWQATSDGWKILYHQGTIVLDT